MVSQRRDKQFLASVSFINPWVCRYCYTRVSVRRNHSQTNGCKLGQWPCPAWPIHPIPPELDPPSGPDIIIWHFEKCIPVYIYRTLCINHALPTHTDTFQCWRATPAGELLRHMRGAHAHTAGRRINVTVRHLCRIRVLTVTDKSYHLWLWSERALTGRNTYTQDLPATAVDTAVENNWECWVTQREVIPWVTSPYSTTLNVCNNPGHDGVRDIILPTRFHSNISGFTTAIMFAGFWMLDVLKITK